MATGRRAALGAIALVMLGASAGHADFPASSCEVTFSLQDASTLGALQFRVDYSAAGGEFEYELAPINPDCTTTMPNAALSRWVDYSGPDVLHFAAASTDGMTGPAEIGHCQFRSAVAPDPADFVITMEDGIGLGYDGNSTNVCGAPVTGQFPPHARDAYVVLRKAIGHAVTCDPCECDPNDSGVIDSTDALHVLRSAAGENTGMTGCPDCVGPPSSTSVTTSVVVTAAVECTSVCPPIADPTCGSGEKSSFVCKNPSNGKRSFKWKMGEGPATAQANLGDPFATTSYLLCIYDSYGSSGDFLVAETIVPPNSNWIDEDPAGLKYRDKTGSSDGVTSALIKTGGAGLSSFAMRAKGSNVTVPPNIGAQYFSQTPSIVVQLHNDAVAQCWSSEFTTNRTNTSTKFSARTP